MVNGRESRNVPVSPQQNGIIYSENQETLANVAITNGMLTLTLCCSIALII